jgi:hypothetical protein
VTTASADIGNPDHRGLILRGVKEVLKSERRKAGVTVSLPIVRSKRPGTVALDNARIYDMWVALTYEGHAHHRTAATWFTTLKPDLSLVFCRRAR